MTFSAVCNRFHRYARRAKFLLWSTRPTYSESNSRRRMFENIGPAQQSKHAIESGEQQLQSGSSSWSGRNRGVAAEEDAIGSSSWSGRKRWAAAEAGAIGEQLLYEHGDHDSMSCCLSLRCLDCLSSRNFDLMLSLVSLSFSSRCIFWAEFDGDNLWHLEPKSDLVELYC